MAIKSRLKPSVEFSASSMADLVFLLLIFFMLTSSFVIQSRIRIDYPEASGAPPESSGVSITITFDDKYYWNDEEILPEETDWEPKHAELVKKIVEVYEDDIEENDIITLRTDKEVVMDKAAKVIAVIAENNGTVLIATEQK